jgi:hypothetical protein
MTAMALLPDSCSWARSPNSEGMDPREEPPDLLAFEPDRGDVSHVATPSLAAELDQVVGVTQHLDDPGVLQACPEAFPVVDRPPDHRAFGHADATRHLAQRVTVATPSRTSAQRRPMAPILPYASQSARGVRYESNQS